MGTSWLAAYVWPNKAVGEWIKLNFGRTYNVHLMRIVNGGDCFKQLKIEFSNGHQLITTLTDDRYNFQDVNIPNNVGKGVNSVKITEISNYYGPIIGFFEIQVFSY